MVRELIARYTEKIGAALCGDTVDCDYDNVIDLNNLA